MPNPCPSPATRFKPGQSGNPKGRQPAGLYVSEWLNVFATWPRSKVEQVLLDPKATSAKMAAAHVWLNATTGKGGADLDRIFDRTQGKPKQTTESTVTVNQGDAARQTAATIDADPQAAELADKLADRLFGAKQPTN